VPICASVSSGGSHSSSRFCAACRFLAHQHLVVPTATFKPFGTFLVTADEPCPKLLDFGIELLAARDVRGGRRRHGPRRLRAATR
jgi:hypothetical protein